MIHETDFDAARAAMSGVNDPGRHLSATSPQPCWIALDAAREQAFTGEIVFDSDRDFRVYFDNGVAYYAERTDGSTLGQRLLEADLVDAGQLERGTVRVGGVEHLGRLFDRDASVDRDAVMVYTEDATQALLAELANHVITTSRATAYRHHESGVHRWFAAPPSNGYFTRPVSEVAPVDNSVVEDLPGLPSAESGSIGEDLRIEWDEPIVDVELTTPPAPNGDHELLLSDADEAGPEDLDTPPVDHPLRRAADHDGNGAAEVADDVAVDVADEPPIVGEVFWAVDRSTDDPDDMAVDDRPEPEGFVVEVDFEEPVEDVAVVVDVDFEEPAEDVEEPVEVDQIEATVDVEVADAAADIDVDSAAGEFVSPFSQPPVVDLAAPATEPAGDLAEPFADWSADEPVAADVAEPFADWSTDEPIAADPLTATPDPTEPLTVDPAPAVPVAEASPPAVGSESLVVDLDALTPDDDEPELVYEPSSETPVDSADDDDFVIVWPDGTEQAPSPVDDDAPTGGEPVATGHELFLETIAEIQAADEGEPDITPWETEAWEPAVEDVSAPEAWESGVVEDVSAPEAWESGVVEDVTPIETHAEETVADAADPTAHFIAGEVLLPHTAAHDDVDPIDPTSTAAEPVEATPPSAAVEETVATEAWDVEAPAASEVPTTESPVVEPWTVEPLDEAPPQIDEPVISFGAEEAPDEEWFADDELLAIDDVVEEPAVTDPVVTEDPVFSGPFVAEDLSVAEPVASEPEAWASEEPLPTEWPAVEEPTVTDPVVTEDPVFSGPFVAEDPSVAEPVEPVYTESQLAAEPSFADGSPDQGTAAPDVDPEPAPIDFEVPSLVLTELPETESAVPEEVSDAVLRAIRAIENASAVSPAVPSIGTDEPAEPSVPAEPDPFGFAPPTPDMSAEAIYAAAARESAPVDEQVDGEHSTAVEPAPEPRVASVVFVDDDVDDEPEPEDRAGALRRLINSLRRR